ncbi:MAG: ATPase, partial [Clostridia bacterium]|nr:ATPase [Clostridia bacterium]
ADAHNQAELIVQEAGQRRLQLIEENSITEAARARAEEIISEANARAKEIRHGTREYVDNTLLGLSEFLAKTYNEVEANRKSM